MFAGGGALAAAAAFCCYNFPLEKYIARCSPLGAWLGDPGAARRAGFEVLLKVSQSCHCRKWYVRSGREPRERGEFLGTFPP